MWPSQMVQLSTMSYRIRNCTNPSPKWDNCLQCHTEVRNCAKPSPKWDNCPQCHREIRNYAKPSPKWDRWTLVFDTGLRNTGYTTGLQGKLYIGLFSAMWGSLARFKQRDENNTPLQFDGQDHMSEIANKLWTTWDRAIWSGQNDTHTCMVRPF